MKNRIFLDIHVLQTIPPSCVNRDDTGSPKTATYGGVTRARVSSQSWKRAMRTMFKELYPEEKLAYRTKKVIATIAEEILKLHPLSDAEKMAGAILEAAGIKYKSDTKETGALFFISAAQAKALAQLAADNSEELDKPSKEFKTMAAEALKQNPGIDIALFGRMVAEDPTLNTDASAQVAHSISTHRVSNEYDYFTAVDDRSPKDNAGAAHIGTIEYNSSTLYRYATVAVHSLNTHLENETAEAVKNFVYSFICSMPDGKQNTFANRTLPDAIMVTIRTDQPINLVGAYERAIMAKEEGYVTESAKRLARHAKAVYADFAGEPHLAWVIGSPLATTGFGEVLTLDSLLPRLEKEIDVLLGNA